MAKNDSVKRVVSDEEDEDDYMSDKFLQEISDVRPGLQKSKEKRNNTKTSTTPPVKRKVSELQKEKLEEGLTKRLAGDNKGFNMLVKMGYKPGMGLGKKEDGRSDPVPLEIMSRREGLGHASDQKRKLQNRMMMNKKRIRMDEEKRHDFRAEMSARFRRQAVARKVASAQNLCLRLDTEIFSFEKPLVSYYWPSKKYAKGEETEESTDEEDDECEEMVDPEELLLRVCQYLRSAHFYCFWCGSKFADEEELLSSCPGESEEDHG